MVLYRSSVKGAESTSLHEVTVKVGSMHSSGDAGSRQ